MHRAAVDKTPFPFLLPSRRSQNGYRLHATVLASMGLTAALVAWPVAPVHAQPALTSPTAVRKNVDIPAGALGAALARFAGAMGVVLSFDAALPAGRSTSGLRGEFSAAEGFVELLKGTGLEAVRQGNDWVLRPAVVSAPPPAQDGKSLSPVTVSEQRDALPLTGPTATHSTTATRIDVNPRQVPQAISIASTDLLSEIGARLVADAAPLLSGVTRNTDSQRSALAVRGFEVSNETLVDGMRSGIYLTFAENDLGMYDRVEILKGHSAVLYGQARPGGSVNYITKKPQFERYGSAELSVAQNNYQRAVFDVTGPISDTLAYRLVVVGQNEDSHVANAYNDRRIVSPSLLWKTPAGGSLLLRYEHAERDYTTPAGAVVINGQIVRYPVHDPRKLGESSQNDHVRMTLTQPLVTGWKLSLDAGYARSYHLQQRADFFPVGSVNPTQSRGNYFRQDRFSDGHEVRAEVHGDLRWGAVRHRLIAGVENYRQAIEITRTHNTNFAVGPLLQPNFGATLPAALSPAQLFDNLVREEGLFINNFLDVGERWHVLAGMRHTRHKRLAPLTGVTEDDSKATTPSVGLVYDVSPSLSVYASGSRSFFPNGGQARDGSFFAPLRGTNREVGLKGDALDKRLNYNAALFELVQDNVTTIDPVNPAFSVLTGEVTVKGVEFDVSWVLSNRWSLIGALTLLDAKITRNNSGLVGNQPSNAPHATGGLRLSYRGDGGWRLGGTLSHVGARKVSQGDQTGVPGYTRLDLDASWRAARHWTLSATLENAFNKDYIAAARATQQILTGRPRTATLSAKYEF